MTEPVATRASWKMTPEMQRFVVIALAEYKSLSEIKKMLKDTYNIDITICGINKYRDSEKWKPIFEKYRDEYDRKVCEVPLAHKRKRLDELQKIYELSFDKRNYTRCLSIIREFREEVEGKQFTGNHIYLTNITNNEFTNLTDEKLAEIKLKDIARLEQIRKMKELGYASEVGEAEEDDGHRRTQSKQALLEESGSAEDVEEPAE